MTEPSVDLSTVVRLVGGQQLEPPVIEPQVVSPPTVAGDAQSPAVTGPFSRLCSPATAAAGGAGPDAIVILASRAETERYAQATAGGAPRAGLVVIGSEAEWNLPGGTVVQVRDTRLALAELSSLFDRRAPPAAGRHPSTVVEAGAQVADDAALGAGVVVAAGASIGSKSVIGANSYIGRGSRVGAACTLYPNVTVYDGVSVGDRAIIHAGAVIGADGFGYAASPTGAVKIRHTGGVRLGDDVEIGANTAVDRGTIDDTTVGPRTKIDNLCQIGHNVSIGSDCLVAGTAAIGGSTVIGNGVIIGGNVAISDHVRIGDGARVAGRSGVTKDVPAGETWAGFPARPYRQYVRSLYLGDRLERMWEYVRKRTKAGEE